MPTLYILRAGLWIGTENQIWDRGVSRGKSLHASGLGGIPFTPLWSGTFGGTCFAQPKNVSNQAPWGGGAGGGFGTLASRRPTHTRFSSGKK